MQWHLYERSVCMSLIPLALHFSASPCLTDSLCLLLTGTMNLEPVPLPQTGKINPTEAAIRLKTSRGHHLTPNTGPPAHFSGRSKKQPPSSPQEPTSRISHRLGRRVGGHESHEVCSLPGVEPPATAVVAKLWRLKAVAVAGGGKRGGRMISRRSLTRCICIVHLKRAGRAVKRVTKIRHCGFLAVSMFARSGFCPGRARDLVG